MGDLWIDEDAKKFYLVRIGSYADPFVQLYCLEGSHSPV